MTADVFPIRSKNPHADCHLFPCRPCRDQRKAEQEARDRHPAGKALPAVLDYDVDRTDNVIRLHVPGTWIELDESMLAELTSALINPPKCDRDDCYEAGDHGGLCVAHREAAGALPSGGWRK